MSVSKAIRLLLLFRLSTESYFRREIIVFTILNMISRDKILFFENKRPIERTASIFELFLIQLLVGLKWTGLITAHDNEGMKSLELKILTPK